MLQCTTSCLPSASFDYCLAISPHVLAAQSIKTGYGGVTISFTLVVSQCIGGWIGKLPRHTYNGSMTETNCIVFDRRASNIIRAATHVSFAL